ncbi:MAG TPA: ferrous iron transporter B, partial [Firmicutes bacterium]|nr:ferrous iron transporter B [Bacillota bacterium]
PEGILLPFEVVMPTMLSIYFIMALLEDSGLMPRIAVMMDRLMSFLNLPGQSVIPIVLGFGCRAPGILATRTLPGRSSRLIVSALLAIPIPCAATLGIIAGVGKHFGANLKIVYGSILVVFFLIARIMAQYLREDQELMLEIPPVQLPSARGVGAKVWMRFEGFFNQVLPVLMITGIGVKILLNTRALSGLARLDPISTRFLGISGQSLAAVAVTVVQRYAAPMVLLNLPLGPREATIAASMISLSMPCLPVSFLVAKEFGWKTLAAIFAMALMISLGTGFALNLLLPPI